MSAPTALPHVVDDGSAILLDSHPRHVGAESVDAHHGIGMAVAHHTKGHAQPAYLLGFAHLSSARTGGESPHVDDGAPLAHYLIGTPRHLILAVLTAGGIKRIGRDIEDTHHLR